MAKAALGPSPLFDRSSTLSTRFFNSELPKTTPSSASELNARFRCVTQ